jgi:hypothetical protein
MTRTILFLFLCISAQAQDIITSDSTIKKHGIKTKTQWLCDSNGENCKPQIIVHYDKNGCMRLKETYVGDSLAETNRYEYNTSLQANTVYTTYGRGKEFINIRYAYDAKGKMTIFQACYASGKCEPFEKYVYRPDGKLMSRTRFKEGKYFYEYRHKYDKLGNNIEVLILSNDSDSGEREMKTFDRNGRHVRSKWVDYRGEEIDNAEYSYDEAGRMLKNEWIGGLSTKKLYEYDHAGNNIKYTSIDYNGLVDDQRTMTYEGDLIQTRIQTDGKKTTNFWKFTYEKW